MRLKSYFASSIEGALNLARQELGQEAMLLDSHRTGPESKHLGEYEVVCAVLPVPTAEPSPSAEPIASVFPHHTLRAPSLDKLCAEVAELKPLPVRVPGSPVCAPIRNCWKPSLCLTRLTWIRLLPTTLFRKSPIT
jgi:hypothetical protein